VTYRTYLQTRKVNQLQPERDAEGWPLSIPWPRRGEFCTGYMIDESGRCCLTGWLRVAFAGNPFTPVCHGNPRARAVLKRMYELALPYRASGPVSMMTMTRLVQQFNDRTSTTDAKREWLWAESWGTFDYQEAP